MSTPGPAPFPEAPNPAGQAHPSANPSSSGTGNPYQSPQPEYVPPSPQQLAEVHLQQQLKPLFDAGRNGANWFYWAAGLSVVNATLMLCGANWHFFAGLAIVDIVSVFGRAFALQHPNEAPIFYGIAIAMDAAAIGLCALFGWLSNKRMTWLMVVGMVIYVLDGLLLLLFMNIFSVAFHAFVLLQMIAGFNAFRKLNALEQQIIQGHVSIPQTGPAQAQTAPPQTAAAPSTPM